MGTKRYVKLKNSNRIIDTLKLETHIECYIKKNNDLYVEHIDGSQIFLGEIEYEIDKLGTKK